VITPEPSLVEVFVGPEGLKVDVWDRYTFDLSMLEVGLGWTLSFWYSERARASWQLLNDPARGVKNGHRVTVTIDGSAVLTGLIESRLVGDEEGQEPVFVISGRDMLGAASAWDADPTLTFAGRTLEDALAAVYQGVGIVPEVSLSVREETNRTATRMAIQRRSAFARRVSELSAKAQSGNADAAAELQRVQIHGPQPYSLVRTSHPALGEKVQSVVDRIVRGLGYRVWATASTDNQGSTPVIVDRPRTTGEAQFHLLRTFIDGRMTETSNILAGKETSSIRDVPTRVAVFADAPRGDARAAKIAREVTNGFLLTDAAAARVAFDAPERPRYVQSKQARSEAGAHNEAARICARANELFRVYEATVLGHRQNGRLWVPNVRAGVVDELVGIDETMLVTTVRYSGSHDESPKTRLTLVPDGALSEIPEPEP